MKKLQPLIAFISGLAALVFLIAHPAAQVGPGPSGPPIRISPMLPTLVGGPIVGTSGTYSGAVTLTSLIFNNAGSLTITNPSNNSIALSGDISAVNFGVAATGSVNWLNRSILTSPANGQLNLTNFAGTAGVGMDVTTDGKLAVRNRAQSSAAIVSASSFQTATALVATGAGGAATLGQVGATGPTTNAQNSWVQMIDSTGAAFWVPVWK